MRTTAIVPVTLNVSGGYPRTHATSTGQLFLATSTGGSPVARCDLFSTRDALQWTSVVGPEWSELPPGTDLSNCAPGESPGGTLLVGVRHHNGAEEAGGRLGARPRRWSSTSTFRIQVARQRNSTTWERATTIYSTTDRDHAAWEPVLFTSLNKTTLRVAYSLERPASWLPPDCEHDTNYPGSDIAPPAVAPSGALCQGRCVSKADCVAWSWRRTDQLCWLKEAGHSSVADPHVDSGAVLCGAGVGGGEGGDDEVHASSAATAGEAMGEAAQLVTPVEAATNGGRVDEWEGREQDVVVQESADDGLTWGPVRVISRTAGSRDGMPSVVRQRDGCLTLVHEGFGGTSWGHFTVNAVRSCDDGGTWHPQPVFPTGSAAAAHAPTIALLPDGRGAMASYDDSNNAQMQTSLWPLNGTEDPGWGAPRVVVPSPAAWPNVFTDALSSRLWIAFGRGRATQVTGPLDAALRAPLA